MPLFLLGNFRSGSTFLHRLLSRDDNFTSLTIWDIYLTPSVTQKKITQFVSRLDYRLGGHLHRLLFAFDRASLGKIRIHPISFFKPEEDENIHSPELGRVLHQLPVPLHGRTAGLSALR